MVDGLKHREERSSLVEKQPAVTAKGRCLVKSPFQTLQRAGPVPLHLMCECLQQLDLKDTASASRARGCLVQPIQEADCLAKCANVCLAAVLCDEKPNQGQVIELAQ